MSKCDFNKVEITLRHGCSPVNLLHVFRTPFLKNTSEWLLLDQLLLSNSNVSIQHRRLHFLVTEVFKLNNLNLP